MVPVGPLGPEPLPRVAVSVIWPLVGTVGEAWVEKVGTRLAIVTWPAGSPQAVETASLLASPLYWATYW